MPIEWAVPISGSTDIMSEYKRRRIVMSLVKAEYSHIVIGEDGVPIIASTTMKVVELVVEKMAYGWSPEELHFQHPILSLVQIYSALAYYWEHEKEFNRDIERRLKRADQMTYPRLGVVEFSCNASLY